MLVAGLLAVACATPEREQGEPLAADGVSSLVASSPENNIVQIEMRYRVEAPGETERARF